MALQPGEYLSGGRVWDSQGRPVVKTRPVGAAGQAGDYSSGGKLLDVNGYEVVTSSAAGATKTPDQVTGLAVWLKADAGVLDGGGAAITADGTAVATWQDQSGNGRHATQATAGKRPLWKQAVVATKPVLRWDGTDDGMATAAFNHNATFTAIVVCAYRAGAFVQNILDNNNLTFQHRFEDGTHWNALGFDSGAAAKADNSVDTIANFAIRTMLRSAGVVEGIINGNSNGGFSAGSEKAGGSAVLGLASFGGGGTGQLLNGDIAEVVYYDNPISLSDRIQVERGLAAKYGLTVP